MTDLEKTLKLVDEVVDFYNVSKEVDVTIRNGPGAGALESFLQAMDSVEHAVKYFEKNNSQSVELENLVLHYFTIILQGWLKLMK